MKNYTYVGISFIILVFGIWGGCEYQNRKKTDLQIVAKAPNFQFTNQDNKTISNKDYEEKVYVVEFFFTTCPSICPIMNRNMVELQNEFYGNPNFGIASFTINPENDTSQVLKNYANQYKVTHPYWHFLTGDKTEIYKLANTFNLYVGENEDAPGGFEHSGMFALIDKNGNIRCRKDENDNPIVYYDGIESAGIQMLKEDIAKLLKE